MDRVRVDVSRESAAWGDTAHTTEENTLSRVEDDACLSARCATKGAATRQEAKSVCELTGDGSQAVVDTRAKGFEGMNV